MEKQQACLSEKGNAEMCRAAAVALKEAPNQEEPDTLSLFTSAFDFNDI